MINPALLQPLIGAAIIFGVAVLGYLTAMVQAHTRAISANQAALLTTLAGRRGAVPAVAHVGGSASAGRQAPLWNQLNDPLPTGALPAQRYNECGEECVAMVIYAQHGVSVEADYLRWQLGGPSRSGLTDGADLVTLLARNNVPAQLVTLASAAMALRLQAITESGKSAIVLGDFDAPGILHWILVTRADSRGCGFNDPWGGVRKAATWADLVPHFDGQLVEVVRVGDSAQ